MVFKLDLKFKIELHKTMYKCEYCDYSTSRLLNFNRHRNRKNPCKRRFIDNLENVEEEQNIHVQVPDRVSNVHDRVSNVHVNLTCSKCFKVFTRKSIKLKHESKCDGLDSRQCKICLKMFTTSQSKWNHNKYVKCKPPIQSTPHTINNINNTNNINNNINNSITNSNNTQNNNINVHLALNFGNEDLSGLINDPNYMKNVENQIQSFISQLPYLNEDAGKIIIGEIMKKIYFNKKYPQNQTIKKTCKKDNSVKVYQDNQWKLQMIEDVFKRVTHKVEEYLSPYFETLNDKYESLQQEDLTREDRLIITNSRGFGNKVVWFNWDDILQPIIKINEVINKTLQLPDIDDEDFSNEDDLKLQNKILKNTIKYLSQHLYENTRQQITQ